MKEHPYFKNFLVTEDGRVISKNSGKVLSLRVNEFGYVVVQIYDPVQNIHKHRKVHRLVAETYIDNPHSKPEVNHIDSNKLNNNVTNLEWVTSKENKDHAWANNLYTAFAENHPDTFLSNSQVHEMCRLMEEGARNKDLADAFGISKDLVSSIRTGRNWKSISSLYKIDKKRTERKSPESVITVAELLELGFTDREVSERTGMCSKEVNRIRNRRTHKTLTKDYVF